MKNMDLDIPLPSTQNLFPVLRNWNAPSSLLDRSKGGYFQCTECKGGMMCIVHSPIYNTNVLKYCLACNGTGKIKIGNALS